MHCLIAGPQLSFLIYSAEVTLWSVDLDETITACEGTAARRLCPHIPHTATIIGQKACHAFAQFPPEIHDAVGPILRGDTSDAVFEVELGRRWYRIRLFPSRGAFAPLDTTGITAGCADPTFVGMIGRRGSASNSSGSNEDSESITGAVMVALDITEAKRTYVALEESLLEKAQLLASETAAKDASKTKSEFLGTSRLLGAVLPRMLWLTVMRANSQHVTRDSDADRWDHRHV